MSSKLYRLSLLAFLLLLYVNLSAAQWMASGPEGGEVRSFASDPQNPDHIFLGTSSGTIFVSADAGRSWSRYAHLGHDDDYVIDHMAVDPVNSRYVYAAAWTLADHHAGELFRSFDGGRSWQTVPAMHGKSIRSMAVMSSHPGLVLVGALDGVFRSKDSGQHWQKISTGRREIRNVESIAIEPTNMDVIYAGTWHLAWKTTNGGVTWRRIDKGMIDDSDVFSMVIDWSNSQVVFAGACSGIYKSQNAGVDFQRIQEIPFSARRTRVLKQEPNNSSVVYAGTTEGLWVTTDSGGTWKRVTGPDVVVNDVLVDPRHSGRVLVATDREGVLASANDEMNFRPSNSGFAHRYISSIVSDRERPGIYYLGVVNDRENGGVFVSNDGGQHWLPKNDGLKGLDVFVLKQAADGTLIVGTNNGLFTLTPNATTWKELRAANQSPSQHGVMLGRNPNAITGMKEKVNDLAITPGKWIAATSGGVYISLDQGENWTHATGVGRANIRLLAAQHNLIVLTTPRAILVSEDGGKTWRKSHRLPQNISNITSLIVTQKNDIIFGSNLGAYRSKDLGTTWQRLEHGLPKANITSLCYDENNGRLIAISSATTRTFESNDGGLSWHRGPNAGLPLRTLCIAGGRIVAATRFDGVLVETKNPVPGSASGRYDN